MFGKKKLKYYIWVYCSKIFNYKDERENFMFLDRKNKIL